MKITLSIIFLFTLWFVNPVYAENIFRCKITHGLDNQKIEYIIKANDDYRLLVDINSETNKIDDSSELQARNVSTGEVIKFINNGKAETFKMIVFTNNEMGDQSYFKAIYFKDISGFSEITTIRITPWEENAPIVVYDNYENIIYEGTCK